MNQYPINICLCKLFSSKTSQLFVHTYCECSHILTATKVREDFLKSRENFGEERGAEETSQPISGDVH